MPMTEKQWTTLARDLRRALARVAPEWTDHNVHDPGTTILELISYALDELRSRSGALGGHAGELSRTVVERAMALAASTASRENDECGPGLQRVNYASGMLLGVDEFRAEQPADLALPAQGAELLVLLRYAERPCRLAPVVASSAVDTSDGSSAAHPTRIVESFTLALARSPTEDAVTIARLRQAHGRWRVDTRFKAIRLGKR